MSNNLFPTGTTFQPTTITTQEVSFGKTWAFDRATGEFALSPSGKFVEVSDVDAWVEWCRNALDANRYQHLVHSRSFGQEFTELFTLGLSRAGNESEIKRIISETLLVDPRTQSVDDFSFKWATDSVEVTFTAKNIKNQTATVQTSIVT